MNDHKAKRTSKVQIGSSVMDRIQAGRRSGQKTLQNLLNQKGNQSLQDGERQLNKLKRQELLEILVEQSREIDLLKEELKEAQERLADRKLNVEEAGTLAEASLRIYHIFDTAQKAADLYLENVKWMTGHEEAPKTGSATLETLENTADAKPAEETVADEGAHTPAIEEDIENLPLED